MKTAFIQSQERAKKIETERDTIHIHPSRMFWVGCPAAINPYWSFGLRSDLYLGGFYLFVFIVAFLRDAVS